MSSRWSTVALGALVLTAIGVLPAPASASGRAAGPAAPAWSPCPGMTWLDCAQVQVPLDHARPRGPMITLALIRQPAEDQENRLGTLFVNPGGPGGSGVDLVAGFGYLIGQALDGRYDLVGFDPRGVARSSPLVCFDTVAQQRTALAPWPFPVGPVEVALQEVYDRNLAASCARQGGPILDHMSTAEVARDLDLLRAAVGDRRLNYLGYSYGTQLGSVYAALFPDRVGRMVLDGVVDPVAWTTGTADRTTLPFTTRLRSDKSALATLDQFLTLCDQAADDDRAETGCALGPGARARFDALATALSARPLPLSDGSTFSYADLIGITVGALYSASSWQSLAELLAALEAAVGSRPTATATATSASSVRAVTVARAALARRLGAQEEDPEPDGPGVAQTVEGFAGVACSDSRNPVTYPAWPRAARWAAGHGGGRFAAVWTWASSACQAWPARPTGRDPGDRYEGPWNSRTATQVLVVGNQFDPATRYTSAVRLASTLPGARLLSYRGWGHSAFLVAGSHCVDQTVRRYLVDGVPPAWGATCRPEFDPFQQLRPLARGTSLGATFGVGPARMTPVRAVPPGLPGAIGLPPATERAFAG